MARHRLLQLVVQPEIVLEDDDGNLSRIEAPTIVVPSANVEVFTNEGIDNLLAQLDAGLADESDQDCPDA